jgi:hypothetical protein
MSYIYKYNKQYQTLQQFDEFGTLRSSMSMPQSDLNALVILSAIENILHDLDTDVENDV